MSPVDPTTADQMLAAALTSDSPVIEPPAGPDPSAIYEGLKRPTPRSTRPVRFRGARRKRSAPENLVEATVAARRENNRSRPGHLQLTTNVKKVRREVAALVKQAQGMDYTDKVYIPV